MQKRYFYLIFCKADLSSTYKEEIVLSFTTEMLFSPKVKEVQEAMKQNIEDAKQTFA